MVPQLRAGTAEEDPRLRNLANRKICANLFLQQLIYFGTFFDFGWILFWGIWCFSKYWRGTYFRDDDVVRMVMQFIWLVFEPLRMVAGWYGNLQENMAWLILFTALSLAPLHVVVYYIMLNGFDMGPVSISVQICQAILLDLQLLMGIFTLFRMHYLQKKQYYLFEYVMNQRRRNDDYRESTAGGPPPSSGGGIGRGGQRR